MEETRNMVVHLQNKMGGHRKIEERKGNRGSNFLLKIQNLFTVLYRTK